MRYVPTVAVATLTLTLGLAACGEDSPQTDRTVNVDMNEYGYRPATVQVERGTSVRFIFKNKGDIVHEAVIGNQRFQDEHEAAAEAEGQHHGGGQDDAAVAQADPGRLAELVHSFDTAGEFLIGCHEPGHYAEGMVATVQVA